MNDMQRTRIRHAANTEAVRRMLISYFISKGFDSSFDRSVNPIAIQDLPYITPGLDTKIEIEPHAIEIDPTTSRATLGWNMFVLGNQRIFLGETYHTSLTELAKQIKTGQILPETVASTRRCTTPRRIITFVERVIRGSNAGYTDLTPRQHPMQRPQTSKMIGAVGRQDSQFYGRTGI